MSARVAAPHVWEGTLFYLSALAQASRTGAPGWIAVAAVAALAALVMARRRRAARG